MVSRPFTSHQISQSLFPGGHDFRVQPAFRVLVINQFDLLKQILVQQSQITLVGFRERFAGVRSSGQLRGPNLEPPQPVFHGNSRAVEGICRPDLPGIHSEFNRHPDKRENHADGGDHFR